MDVIKGSELKVSDAIFAWQLDGKGGAKPVDCESIIDNEHPCWLHLNYTFEGSAAWLASTPLIPDNVRDALRGEGLRPRVSRQGEGSLITLRCVNGNDEERPEDRMEERSEDRPEQMVAMPSYMTDRFIITTCQRPILALDDVISDLATGSGPTTSGSWLVSICDALTDHASDFVEQLHDRVIVLEDDLLEQKIPPRGTLALLRKQLIVMRRYMAPQRDVYARLANDRINWLSDDQRRLMQDIADRLGRRGLDEIDSCIARTAVMNDEISQQMQEALGKRTYTMSLMAMVFLPSTFLTGLFGVNLGVFRVQKSPLDLVCFVWRWW